MKRPPLLLLAWLGATLLAASAPGVLAAVLILLLRPEREPAVVDPQD